MKHIINKLKENDYKFDFIYNRYENKTDYIIEFFYNCSSYSPQTYFSHWSANDHSLYSKWLHNIFNKLSLEERCELYITIRKNNISNNNLFNNFLKSSNIILPELMEYYTKDLSTMCKNSFWPDELSYWFPDYFAWVAKDNKHLITALEKIIIENNENIYVVKIANKKIKLIKQWKIWVDLYRKWIQYKESPIEKFNTFFINEIYRPLFDKEYRKVIKEINERKKK